MFEITAPRSPDAWSEFLARRGLETKYAWDASMEGSHLQDYPLRDKRLWSIPEDYGSKLQNYPLRDKHLWGVGAEPASLSFDGTSLVLGFVLGLAAYSYFAKRSLSIVKR